MTAEVSTGLAAAAVAVATEVAAAATATARETAAGPARTKSEAVIKSWLYLYHYLGSFCLIIIEFHQN